jgi:hypothetical protein
MSDADAWEECTKCGRDPCRCGHELSKEGCVKLIAELRDEISVLKIERPRAGASVTDLVLHVESNDDPVLTCILCGHETTRPPELRTSYLAPHGRTAAGIHRRCFDRARRVPT